MKLWAGLFQTLSILFQNNFIARCKNPTGRDTIHFDSYCTKELDRLFYFHHLKSPILQFQQHWIIFTPNINIRLWIFVCNLRVICVSTNDHGLRSQCDWYVIITTFFQISIKSPYIVLELRNNIRVWNIFPIISIQSSSKYISSFICWCNGIMGYSSI